MIVPDASKNTSSVLSAGSKTSAVKLMINFLKVPALPTASSTTESVQSPLICSPAKAAAKVPPSGLNIPVNGAVPVVILAALSVKTVSV